MGDTELGQVSFKDMEEYNPKKQPKQHWYEVYVQPCIAELIGTMLFVFIGCMSVIMNDLPGSLQPALAHGLALGLTIAILGGIRYISDFLLYILKADYRETAKKT